jgi:hypothetical protein
MRIALIFLLLAGVALAQDTTEATGATTPSTTSAAPPTPKPAGGEAAAKPAEPEGGAAKPAGGEGDAKPAAQGEGADATVNADVRAAAGGEPEECEEAWEYLEFLKTNIK